MATVPYLYINGVEYEIFEWKEEQPALVGDRDRSWSGKARAAVTGMIRKWSGSIREMTQAEYNTLYAATKMGAHVTCSGPALNGASIVCFVELLGAEFVRENIGHLLLVRINVESVNPTT